MSYWEELKRRNVVKVGVAYVVTGWLLLQVASILFPSFNTPEWVMQAFSAMLFLGFPVALILAWAFDLTPEGIRREKHDIPAESRATAGDRKLNYLIIAALSLALVFVVVDQYVLEDHAAESTEPVSAAPSMNPRDEATSRSIAVLPFRNRSAVAEDVYFVDGIHDDILTQLGKLSEMDKVISRTSMEQYRGTSKTMPQIAQELGVANILEGGVQRAGDRVRINVQLIEATSDELLWGETFDRRLTTTNIFSIQSEIATAVATALQATLSPEERRIIAAVPTRSMEAYDAYQLGRRHLSRRSVESMRTAIGHFEEATRIDRNFGQAWAELATGYMLLASRTAQDVDDLLREAEVALDTALRINEQLAETQTALALLRYRKGDLPGAMQAIDRAVESNQNLAYAYLIRGSLLSESGYPAEATLSYERAVQLDPLSPVIIDAYAFRLSEIGQFDEALSLYQRIDELDPNYPDAASNLGTIYGLSYGRLDLANLWYRKALALDPGNPFMYAVLGLVFLELNDDETAEYWINRSLELAETHTWANGAILMLQSYRGDSEQIRHYTDRVLSVDKRWRFGTALSHGRVPDLRAGKYQQVLDRYESSFPELFGDSPDVNSNTYRPAIDVAGLYLLQGEEARAASLLAESERRVSETIRVGIYGFWISDVQIYALQGRTEEALSALRQAVDQGWVTDWRYFRNVDPNLDSIREESAFQAIMREIETEMAAQLERAREMDTNGELTPIPPRAN